jgi:hypothetical protein
MAKSYQPSEPAQTPAAPPAETQAPELWALEVFPPKPSGASHPDLWVHACARLLHRWSEHAHHSGAPLQLTRADYVAACEAARLDTTHAPAVGAY